MTGERKCSRKLFGNDESLQHGVGHALATPASERKRVHEHGADLLVQFIAHEPPRAMQPRLHRIRLKTEEVRGFLGAHAFDHPAMFGLALGTMIGAAAAQQQETQQQVPLCYTPNGNPYFARAWHGRWRCWDHE